MGTPVDEIAEPLDRLSFERSPQTQARLSQYERQRWAVSKVVEWMKNNPGKMPTHSAFKIGSNKVGVNKEQLFGIAAYKLGAPQHSFRIFDSREQALGAIKAKVEAQGIPFKYLDFQFQGGFPDSLRPEIQKEAALLVVKWRKENPGKMPAKSDHGTDPDQIQISSYQLFGIGAYRDGNPHYSSRVFDSREQALQAIKAEALAQEVPFRYLGFQFRGGFPDSLRPEIQKEAVLLVVEWMKKNPGKVPAQSDYGVQPNKVGLIDRQLYGTGLFKDGGKFHSSRIFNSREDALRAIKAEAQAQGIAFKYLDFRFKEGFPDSLRPEIQLEAVQLVVAWMKKNASKLPTQSDFGYSPENVGLMKHQFFGTAAYKEGGRRYRSRIFDSREEALTAVRAEWERLGNTWPRQYLRLRRLDPSP